MSEMLIEEAAAELRRRKYRGSDRWEVVVLNASSARVFTRDIPAGHGFNPYPAGLLIDEPDAIAIARGFLAEDHAKNLDALGTQLKAAQERLLLYKQDSENVCRDMTAELGREFRSHATDAVMILLDRLKHARTEVERLRNERDTLQARYDELSQLHLENVGRALGAEDQIEKLSRIIESDRKYHNLPEAEQARQLAALRAACEPFLAEARFIADCHLHDAYTVGKIPVKHWQALLAAAGEEEKE